MYYNVQSTAAGDMAKTLFALGGIILFLFGINLGHNLLKGESQALSLDRDKKVYGAIGDGPLPCSWSVETPERVLAEDKSEAIVIQTTNPTDSTCESTLSLRAPSFEKSPAKDEQIITLPAKGKGSLSWIITPNKPGTFDISVSDILNTKVFGVTVTNIFGLSSIQAKLASIFGGIFGPMLTVPWWWDRWRRKKQNQDNIQNDTSQNKA